MSPAAAERRTDARVVAAFRNMSAMLADPTSQPSGSRPRQRSRVAHVVALALAALVTSGIAVYAAIASVDPAGVSELADRIDPGVGDLVVVFDIEEVDRAVVDAADVVARRVGGMVAPSRTGSSGMRRVTRNGATVHSPPSGYLIPMVWLALPRGAVGGVVGTDVSSVLGPGTVALNEMTAGLMGARVGDVIELEAASRSVVPLRVGGIFPYSQLGGSELVFTTDTANRLGATLDTQVVIWGFDDRAATDAALTSVGLFGRKDTRVSRSWEAMSPDDTLSTARTKVALGEPWYVPTGTTTIAMHPTWEANNLTPTRVLLSASIPIRARCHLQVVPALQNALAEVAAAGLGGAIDVANANTYGGCFVARYSRLSGFLSRHAYGMALDTNTVSNCQGCVPQMNCSVVRIFRRHGFAWGGNFRRPDGMHFEWVGERRDQIAYPSPYCPNIVGTATQSLPPTIGLDVLTIRETGAYELAHDH